MHLLSFCGQAPALGAKPLVEGWRRFWIGSPRSHRMRPRGLSLGFARRRRLGEIGYRWFLWRKHNGLRPLQFTRRRLDPLAWCLGGPLWDFRRRDQTGFWRVSKQLFAFSRKVHGVYHWNANFQVINCSASREAKTRGQGQGNERNPSTAAQLVLSVRAAVLREGDTGRLRRG